MHSGYITKGTCQTDVHASSSGTYYCSMFIYLRHVSIVNTVSHSLSNMFDLQVWRKISDDLASLHSKTLIYDPHTISNENAYMDYIWLPGRFLHNSWFNWVLGKLRNKHYVSYCGSCYLAASKVLFNFHIVQYLLSKDMCHL